MARIALTDMTPFLLWFATGRVGVWGDTLVVPVYTAFCPLISLCYEGGGDGNDGRAGGVCGGGVLWI